MYFDLFMPPNLSFKYDMYFTFMNIIIGNLILDESKRTFFLELNLKVITDEKFKQIHG